MLDSWLQKIGLKVPGRATTSSLLGSRRGSNVTASPAATDEPGAIALPACSPATGSAAGRRPASGTQTGKNRKTPPPFVPPRLPNWQPHDIILEHYRVDETLPPGITAGRAWRCHHLAWRLPLLLETPPAELLRNPTGLKRSLKRAETLVKTGLHPNIAASCNLRFVQRLPVMISEYVEGESLAEWLADHRCTSPRIALSLAIQGCHGMEHCHALGLVHGNLRPENIRINPNSLLKITGFGLAPGTAGFSVSADLHAFGHCLQKMFTAPDDAVVAVDADAAGAPAALATDSATRARQNVLPVPATPPANNLPPALLNALRRCLSLDPKQRYPGFAELRYDLNQAYRELFKLPCPYYEPPELDQRAEVLNNQAVFLLEEGRNREAARKLARCLELNDTLPEGVYNELLLRWRVGGTSPAGILRRIEANRQPGRPPAEQDILQPLAKAAKRNSSSPKSDFIHDHEAGPEFRLVAPPRRLAIYRRSAQRRQMEEKIHDHLINRRYQACFETLLKAWRPEGFRKDRYFNRIYDELLQVRQKLRPIQGQRFLTLTGHQAPVNALACIPDSRRIVSAGRDGRLLIHHLGTGTRPEMVENHEVSVTTLAVAPGGKQLAVGTREGGVHLVSGRTGKILGQEQSHRAPVSALAFNHDGKLLASGGEDGSIIVRRLATGREDGVTLPESGAITALLYPDQELELVSGSDDGRLRHWKSRLRDCTASIPAHAGAVYALAAVAGGERLLSAGADRRVKIWPRHGEQQLQNLKGHSARIRAVLGLADGGSLASAGDDDLIDIRALANGEKLFSLDGRGGGIHSLAPGPRPHTLLAGRGDGTINVWQLIYQLDFDII